MIMSLSSKHFRDLEDDSSQQSYDTSRCDRSSAPIEIPGEHDLLLGRGGETNSHGGNVKFRKMIEEYKPIYLAASRRDKPEIAKQLVGHWKSLGGRFLEKHKVSNKDGEASRKLWFEISDEAAKKRASKSLGEKQKLFTAYVTAAKEAKTSCLVEKHRRLSMKSRRRGLEDTLTNEGERRCPRRSDPVTLSFPKLHNQDCESVSFPSQPLHFEIAPLQSSFSGATGAPLSERNYFLAATNVSPLVEEGRQQRAFADLPNTKPLVLNNATARMDANPTIFASSLSPFRPSDAFFAKPEMQDNPSLARLFGLDDQGLDVPTAAELTSCCWDD